MTKRSSQPREVRTDTPTLRPDPPAEPGPSLAEHPTEGEIVLKALVDFETKMARVDERIDELQRDLQREFQQVCIERLKALEARLELLVEPQSSPGGPFVIYKIDEGAERLALVIDEAGTLFVFGYGKNGFVVVTGAVEGDQVGQWRR